MYRSENVQCSFSKWLHGSIYIHGPLIWVVCGVFYQWNIFIKQGKWNVQNTNYCKGITKGTTVADMMFAQLENGICIDFSRQSKTIIKQTNKQTSLIYQQMSWSSGQFSTTGVHQISLWLHSIIFSGYRRYISPVDCMKNIQCFSLWVIVLSNNRVFCLSLSCFSMCFDLILLHDSFALWLKWRLWALLFQTNRFSMSFKQNILINSVKMNYSGFGFRSLNCCITATSCG